MQSEPQPVTIPQAIQAGLEHHQAGRLPEAERIYQSFLEVDPDNPDALHLLGVIAHQTGKGEIAVELIGKAVRYCPSNPYFLNNLGEANRGLRRLEEALASYDKALTIKPDYAEASCNRGIALQGLNRYDEALASYDKALTINPDYVEALINRGFALQKLNRYDESLASYDKALTINPDYIEAFSNRGVVLQELNRFDEALASYDKALTIKPVYAENLHNRGLVLHKLKRYDEALASYDKALTIKPDYAEAFINRGAALWELNRCDEALASIDKALSIEPNHARGLSNRGLVLQKLKRYDEALASYDNALAITPDCAEAFSIRGAVLHELKRYDEALASYDRALTIRPGHAETLSNRGLALQELNRSYEALASYDEALTINPNVAEAYFNSGGVLGKLCRLSEAEANYRRALELKPDFLGAHSDLIFTLDLMEHCNAREQQAERRRWFDRFARQYTEAIRPHGNLRDPERRLRIGYVSADFYEHSAYFVIGPILAAHDRAAVDVICYSDVKREDHATERLRRVAQGWRSTLGMSDDALAAQIRSDAIDILVDLSGHSNGGKRLLTFARKPAPVQVTAWGHPTGTGLPTIDYLLADPVLVPPEERFLYAEKVLDLPCCVCYEPPEYLPEVSSLPALSGKPFTFGCLNRLEKISDRVIGLWSRILVALPQSRLLIKAPNLQDASLKADFSRRLLGAGIESTRVELLGKSLHWDHLAAYDQVDLVLDSYPHGGGVSTLEALWMGVPVVTLKGSTAPGRLSASILTAMQMQEWIAGSDEEYVRIAVEAARSLSRLGGVRQGLRARAAASMIGDAQRYCRAVEETYRTIWRRWCRG